GGGSGYELWYIHATNRLRFSIGGQTIETDASVLTTDEFQHIAAVWDNMSNQLRLYRNGTLLNSVSVGSITVSNTNELRLGEGLDGYLDEVLLFNRAKSDQQIEDDYFRIMSDNELDIMAYYRLDEGTLSLDLDRAFDAAKEGELYNQNDGVFVGDVAYSNTIPTSTQLGLIDFTDINGNYTISNVRYAGAGNLFSITPSLGVHEFDPSTLNVFVGEGSIVLNNQDFIDVSSFDFNARVILDPAYPLFAGKISGEVPIAGVNIKVDNQFVTDGGLPVVSDASGVFPTIQVPIGNHTISIEKEGHTFNLRSFTGDFQDDLASTVVFTDTTTRIVTGRVVGGAIEAAKEIGFGLSQNNIGSATIDFVNPNYTDQVTTLTASGEYVLKLPPLLYNVDDFSISYANSFIDPTINFDDDNFNMKLDLRDPLELITSDYTYEDGSDSTFSYQIQKDWIYFAKPQLIGTNVNGISGEADNQFIGLKSITVGGTNVPLTGLNFAVLQQASEYRIQFKARELYKNADDETQIDSVAVPNGEITVSNNLAIETTQTASLNEKGEYLYIFQAGTPNTNINTNPGQEALSFTNTLAAKLEVFNDSGTKINEADWLDGAMFNGFVLGGTPEGTTFAVEGPQVVDFILRDPPGSNSFAQLAKGNSIARSTSFSFEDADNVGISGIISLGLKFESGLPGLSSESEVVNDLELGTSTETRFNESGEYEEVVTLERSWTTSDLSDDVGAGGDLFIGKSSAFIFGLANNLSIIPIANCDVPGVECYETSAGRLDLGGFALGTNKSLALVPGGQDAMFIFSQNNIINFEIPRLRTLRDQLFIDRPDKYVSKTTDPDLFGLDNTDPRVYNAPSD
ncbi:MAG: LamG-like jellyroll fold domain-containing protein, partial [Bacteroidota bacterium]